MKALWIALVWPEPESSAAGVRTDQLLQALRHRADELQVSSPCRQNRFRGRLEAGGIKTVSYPPNDSSFDEYLRQYSPDIVFFDRFMAEEQFGWRVREQCPQAIRVLDTVDLHSLRRSRQKRIESEDSFGAGRCSSFELDLFTEDSIREVSAIYRSHLSLLVSDVELRLLQQNYQVPLECLSLCRWAYPAVSSSPSFESRTHFVTIGNFNHAPNRDSLRMLNEIVWPRIRHKLEELEGPACELHVYGAYPPRECLNLDNPSTGLRVKGHSENSLEMLAKYRVNLAPLRFGAGIKGKISDGWAVGTPCVTTTIGAEGMHEELPFGGCVEDDWEQFADRAVSLYWEQNLFEEAQARGIAIIEALYSQETTTDKFLREVKGLVNLPVTDRQESFIGAMLWYHKNRSSEYFSRWIEAKRVGRGYENVG